MPCIIQDLKATFLLMSVNAGQSSFQNTHNPNICGTWDSLNHDSKEWSSVSDKYILTHRMNEEIHFLY
jgi:hypothetical protein